jgi:hypothetical protein
MSDQDDLKKKQEHIEKARKVIGNAIDKLFEGKQGQRIEAKLSLLPEITIVSAGDEKYDLYEERDSILYWGQFQIGFNQLVEQLLGKIEEKKKRALS